MRRRLLWSAGFVALAGVVAGVVIAFPHPPKEAGNKLSPGGDIVEQAAPAPFKSQRKNEVIDVAQRFVMTAVARKHVEDSWALVCPEMKQGFTKEKWAKGNIPVVPYPVSTGRWRVSYSLQDEIDVQVALFARPKQHIKPVVFDLTVQPCGQGKHWLVSSFIPVPSASGDYNIPDRNNPFGIGTKNPKPLPNHASSTWLLAPAGIVGGTLVLV